MIEQSLSSTNHENKEMNSENTLMKYLSTLR